MLHKPTASLVSLGALFLCLIFSFFFNLGKEPMHLWDESRRAVDALHMYINDVWIIDHYDGDAKHWSTKSPFLLWLQVFSIKIFGINDWSIRFPSAVASLCIGLSIWYFCKKYFNSVWTGLIAGCVFAFSFPWINNHAGRSADYDALLTLFSVLYCFCFFSFCNYKSDKWIKWFYVFLTLAVLIKGASGLFFLPGLALFLLLDKKLKAALTNKIFYQGAGVFILIIGSYYLIREYSAPGFYRAVYGNELGGRYLKGLEENGMPFLYYTHNLMSWRYPFWKYFIVPAFLICLLFSSQKIKRFTWFNIILVVTYWLIISFSKTKLYWYDLPVYPLLSVQIACFVFLIWQRLETVLYGLAPWAKSGVAFLLLCLLLVRPFKVIYMNNIHPPKRWPWNMEIEERKQGYFLKDALAKKLHLNNYNFCYVTDKKPTQLSFYVNQMRLKQIDARVATSIDTLKPGSYAVVSQNEIKSRLEEKYVVQKMDERFDCAIYLIINRKSTALK